MLNSLTIRNEHESDFDAIRDIVKEAFSGTEYSDNDEHNLIDRLRKTEHYIPDLSLVAEFNNKIVGYIMFSLVYIGNVEAIALAPLAVHPAFQNRGIGQALIMTGHQKAKNSRYCCSVVLGSPEYYSRSGYVKAASFGISAPFDIPQQFYMVYPFYTQLPHGIVMYSPAFNL